MALSQEKIYTLEDIYALPDGERAELIDGRIYDMAPPNRIHQKISWKLHQAIAHEKQTNLYTFEDAIPVCIYEDLNICIAELLKQG